MFVKRNIGTVEMANMTDRNRKSKTALLSGCALTSALLMCGLPQGADANSLGGGVALQGTPTVASGGVTFNRTDALDTINISTPQAVINWTDRKSVV